MFKNMNSGRALLLVLWTVCAGFIVAFAAGWMDRFSDVFHPTSYRSFIDFVIFWAVILAPYPVLLSLPTLRRRKERDGG